MAYTKNPQYPWTDNVDQVTGAALDNMELGIEAAHARANHSGTQAPATIAMAASARILGRTTAGAGPAEELTGAQAGAIIGAATTIPRLGIIRVASSQAPADVKAQCNYVCDGTNDQAEINLALKDASRAFDGYGGLGAGCVELVGGDFFTSQDNTTAITMYPATWLRGSWAQIRPLWTTNQDRGAIELLDNVTDHVRVSDLFIGRHASGSVPSFNGHAIKFSQTGSGNANELQTGNDPFILIQHVVVLDAAGKGIYITGTSGGARETQILDCHVWDCTGICFDVSGASDSKLTGCTAQAGSGGPGFQIAGGNTKLSQCKSYFSEANLDGFLVTSSRAELVGCAAQDNGRWGFNISSNDATVVGCVADSNARLTSTGGGFLISGDGVYDGLHCFDRGQTPGSPQLKGVEFSGSPQVYCTGRIDVPSGTAHVTGSPGANSYVRLVRNGQTLHSVG